MGNRGGAPLEESTQLGDTLSYIIFHTEAKNSSKACRNVSSPTHFYYLRMRIGYCGAGWKDLKPALLAECAGRFMYPAGYVCSCMCGCGG